MKHVAFKKINTNKIFIRDIDFLPNFNKLVLIWVVHFKEHLCSLNSAREKMGFE